MLFPLFEMKHNALRCSRRYFLRAGVAAACTGALATPAKEPAARLGPGFRSAARVAIIPCKTYEVKTVKADMARALDLLGGIGKLVRNKTVTVKINLTGCNFPNHLGRPVGETYMTHPATALALTALLLEGGARRVRLVESTTSRSDLETTLRLCDWPLSDFSGLGPVEFENTRNLGKGKRYVTLKVPASGYLFSSFEVNHAYEETDVMVSLCKLKNHLIAGVTLSLKNLFGVTPSSRYGDDAGSEEAVAGRGVLHCPAGDLLKLALPGFIGKPSDFPLDAGYRIPRIVADVCAARPVDLAVIDGITAMEGGEGPWCREVSPLHVTTPGLLLIGLNAVSTDAVGSAVMGYANPRATRGTSPFDFSDNHILLAEQAGLGSADLKQIEVLGQPLERSIYPYKMKLPTTWRP